MDILRPGSWPLGSRWPFGLARAERLLDHRLPGDDPVAQLLSDASRGVEGPVRGEELVALAFRTAPAPVRRATVAAGGRPSTVEAGPSRTVLPRYPARRPIAAPRLLALKVAVIGMATVAVGGVALAHTVDGLTLPFRTTAEKTLPIEGRSDAVAARGGLIPSSSPSPSEATTQAGGDGNQNTVLPSATPAPVPTPAGAATRPAPGGAGPGAQPSTSWGDCKVWTVGPFGPRSQREAWTKAFSRLRSAAGGREHVSSYCFALFRQGAVDGRPYPSVPAHPQYPTTPQFPTYPQFPPYPQYPAYPQAPARGHA